MAENLSISTKQSKASRSIQRREQQPPISQQHYADVLQAFEAPFAQSRLDAIQTQLLARCEQKADQLDRRSLQAKVFLGQELKTRDIHLSKPLRPTETEVKGGLPSVQDVLNEKRAWLEADARRYWDSGKIPKKSI